MGLDPHLPTDMLSGFRRARIRAAQSLPLGWGHLTDIDIVQIRTVVDRHIANTAATLLELEACLLLWSTLVTGRETRQLLQLSMRMAVKGEALRQQVPGLTRTSGQWGWWLVAGAPKDQQLPGFAVAAMRVWSPLVHLPATDRTVRLVEQCLRLRARDTAGKDHLGSAPIPLFTGGAALVPAVVALLRDRHPIAPGRARGATVTPQSLSRWLPMAMMHAPGGDVVPASAVSGRVDQIARTAIHYGSVPQQAVNNQYRVAVERADKLSHHDISGKVVDTHIGDRLTPTDAAVRQLVDRLASALDDPGHDLAERHAAMTHHTVMLLSFATAHRGNVGTLPSLAGIDDDTGFCWIDDKRIGGRASRRLVWICTTARRQLQLYERHLDGLEQVISERAADAIRDFRRSATLALFDMQRGYIQPRTVSQAIGAALAGGSGVPKNVGRHWLRARLVGHCSSETLHALYGHGPVDEGSWDAGSTLDPVVYRADLARVLDLALSELGWVPRAPTLHPGPLP